MGVEDAEALGVVFIGATPSQIPERLRIWESIRLNRSSGIQFYANVGTDQSDARHAGAAKYLPADKIPSEYSVSHVTMVAKMNRNAGGVLPVHFWIRHHS